MEELMSNQPKSEADIPIDCDVLEMWQDDIREAQEELHDALEQIKEALDTGNTIDPKLYQEAEKQIKELEVNANSLRTDLERLKAQQSTSPN
jgi:chromosome segregation ATPase